jgi:hypothetical protein
MSFNLMANLFSPLRHVHPRAAGRIAYFGGGGGQSTPTNQTVTQTNIPEEFMPYFERALGRTEALSLEPYQPYGGRRYTPSTEFADINASRAAVRDIAGKGIAGLDTARAATERNITDAQRLGQYDTGEFSQYNYGDAGEFDSAAAQKYMSPYIQNVLDVQKSRAMQDYQELQGQRNARAVQAGAFGGSRSGVIDAIAQRELGRNMAEIDATGMQKAYESAGTMYGADRTARMDVDKARAAELARIETDREASRQFGAGQGLAAIDAAGAEAGRLVAMGEKEREANIQNAQLLDTTGRDLMAEENLINDIGFQDWLRQQGVPEDRLRLLLDAVQGLPVSAAGTTTATNSSYTNPLTQGVGAGLSALSLYKAYS